MSNVNYEVLTAPTVEPITLTDMKTYLRVDYADEDTLITQLITDARTYAEDITKRALAPQVIRATIEPDRAPQGALSGVVGSEPDPWRYAERISAVPFGFYGPCFQLPRTPVSSVTKVEYQLTPFDINPTGNTEENTWTLLPAQDGNGGASYRLDTNTDPAQLFIMPMLIAERFRFTYNAGYTTCPQPITNAIRSLVSFWFDNRQGEEVPDSITNALARRRVWQL